MYARAGASVTTLPGGFAPVAGGAGVRPPALIGAPAFTQAASVSSSFVVNTRTFWPMYGGESGPGIHGGIRCALVAAIIACACAFASFAVVSANGAIPPTRWQSTQCAARIGPTSFQDG